MYLLKNCNLVPELTESTYNRQADVLLDGDRISAILPCGSRTPEGCTVIDLDGKTLLPGLIDAHVHLHIAKDYPYPQMATPCSRAYDTLRFAQFLLDIGITTVRDMGDDENLPTIALRDAIKAGELTGPNIQAAGVTICPFEAGFQVAENISAFISGPQEMRKMVRRMLMDGADVIKIYGTGSMLAVGSLPGRRILEEDEIKEAVKIAKLKGTYVACHCHGAEAIDVMIDCGVRTIEHASYITEETCRKLDGRRDVGLVLTTAVLSDEALSKEQPMIRNRIEAARKDVFAALKNAYTHDILIGWGTDIPLKAYEACPYVEFKTRKEKLGFSNIDILKQATINSAVLIGMDNEVGSIKEGKLADLIIVGDDPVKDLEIMYKKPLHVIKSGCFIR